MNFLHSWQHFLSGDDPKCIEVEREFTSTQQAKYAESSRTLAQIEKVCALASLTLLKTCTLTPPCGQENVELEALLASLAKDSPNKTAMQREKASFSCKVILHVELRFSGVHV